MPPTARGNLIVGYNDDFGYSFINSLRGGSHNIIVGDLHRYHGERRLPRRLWQRCRSERGRDRRRLFKCGVGLCVDRQRRFDQLRVGQFSSVSGGQDNVADGDTASVAGGVSNEAGGSYSAVSGGAGNAATGFASSVSGGLSQTASGDYSTAP